MIVEKDHAYSYAVWNKPGTKVVEGSIRGTPIDAILAFLELFDGMIPGTPGERWARHEADGWVLRRTAMGDSGVPAEVVGEGTP